MADLTEIVEAVAREHYGDAYDGCDVPTQAWARDTMLHIVTATLRQLAPLADEWERDARECLADGDRVARDSDPEEARLAYREGNTLLSCANELRALIGGAK